MRIRSRCQSCRPWNGLKIFPSVKRRCACRSASIICVEGLMSLNVASLNKGDWIPNNSKSKKKLLVSVTHHWECNCEDVLEGQFVSCNCLHKNLETSISKNDWIEEINVIFKKYHHEWKRKKIIGMWEMNIEPISLVIQIVGWRGCIHIISSPLTLYPLTPTSLWVQPIPQ